MTLTDSDPRHGTANGYDRYGCRCGPCRDAKALGRRSDRRKVKPRPDGLVPFESLLARDRWLAKKGVIP